MVATKSDDPLPSFLYEENPDDFGEKMARYLEVNVDNPNSYSKEELKRLRRRVRNRMSAKKARLESKRRIMKLRRERKDLKAELMKSAGEIEEKIVARYGNYDIYKQTTVLPDGLCKVCFFNLTYEQKVITDVKKRKFIQMSGATFLHQKT